MARKIVRSPWLMVGVTGVLFLVVAFCVDLRPVVDENFFFAASDPAFRQAKKVEERFPSQTQMILAVSSRDISSANYLARIQRLTRRVEEIDAVTSVKSVEAGPKSFADALASPFWSRFLIADDHKSTNVVLFMESGKNPEATIRQLEKIVHELDTADFRIHIAGQPYVAEMIRRSLAHDFWYFTFTALVLFGVTMAALFRSV